MDQAAGLLVVVATYNEIENLPDLVKKILEQLPDAQILVIDDNSPDGTGEWCDRFANEEPRLSCLHRAGKQGLGSATVAGFRHAIDHGYELVLTMDADFSHDPRHLPEILDRLTTTDDADVVVGSRYVAGGRIEGWGWHRRVMSLAINAFARTMLGLPVADCSGAFRAYRTGILRELNLAEIRSSGYSYLEEILWRLQSRGARFAEVPITFVDRQKGQTKINWREAVNAVLVISAMGVRHQLDRLRRLFGS